MSASDETPTPPEQIKAAKLLAHSSEAGYRDYLTQVAQDVHFDPKQDHAALIARLIEARANRYSADRDDPMLGPIIRQESARYGEVRRFDFGFASHVALTEAIRTILALRLPALPRQTWVVEYADRRGANPDWDLWCDVGTEMEAKQHAAEREKAGWRTRILPPETGNPT